MIQLSPQVQQMPVSEPAAHPHTAEAPDNGGVTNTAEKTEKQGGFAKLLQGILKSIKGESGAPQEGDATALREGSEEPEHAETAALKLISHTDPGQTPAALLGDSLPGMQQEGETLSADAAAGAVALTETEPVMDGDAGEGIFSLRSGAEEEAPSGEISLSENIPAPDMAAAEEISGDIFTGDEMAAPEKQGIVDLLPKTARDMGLRDEPRDFSHKGIVDTETAEASPEEGSVNEAKGKDRRRDRLSLEVQDLRTGGPANTQPGPSGDTPADASFSSQSDAEIVVELKNSQPRSESASDSRDVRAGQTFRDALAQELRTGLGSDIVRHASLVLKDSGEGLIKLSLRPESLGTVKIRLEMAENKITGRIIVESDEALKAFEREIRSLEQAFRDSGFDGASLEMALSSESGGDGRQWKGEEARPFFSERLAATSYDALVDYEGRPGNGFEIAVGSDRSVNMLV
ncbi:flagellar hook-length control protein FliK [Breznakiella homolactica]|uniref:Flagellar hook-length control protein FliK n=1 Tax=Breznakiella homolactica TaxID=2798577 RepID=A0A7T8B9E8_9SPIR|nr:flagellar hook-length control protein FliK [Breznakiella homolactica]QQO08256.1 flagellar hook-length control protein FliK [Breznakiella homolactica]